MRDILGKCGMHRAALASRGTYVHLDVTSAAEWDNAVRTAVSSFGMLDILVNNAGIIIRKGVEDTTVEDWDRVMDVNAKGVFLGTKASIPAMRDSGGGSIVNISSIAGMIGSPSLTAYHSSKGAVRLLTKATAIQYASDGIRCNSVHPGIIYTDMNRDRLDNADNRQRELDRIPLGYLGTVDDIAKGVLFLASDESSFMTGSELVIDGGITAQ